MGVSSALSTPYTDKFLISNGPFLESDRSIVLPSLFKLAVTPVVLIYWFILSTISVGLSPVISTSTFWVPKLPVISKCNR